MCSTPTRCWAAWPPRGLFLLYGAVFVALKTSGAIRDDASPVRGVAVASGDRTGCRLWGLDAAGHGKDWTWLVLAVAVVAQLAAVLLVWRARHPTAGRSLCTAVVVAAVVILLFGALYPNLVPSTLNKQWSLTIYNASSTPYTLKIMTWVTAILPR